MNDKVYTLSIPMIDELRSSFDEGANFSMILARPASSFIKGGRVRSPSQ